MSSNDKVFYVQRWNKASEVWDTISDAYTDESRANARVYELEDAGPRFSRYAVLHREKVVTFKDARYDAPVRKKKLTDREILSELKARLNNRETYDEVRFYVVDRQTSKIPDRPTVDLMGPTSHQQGAAVGVEFVRYMLEDLMNDGVLDESPEADSPASQGAG